PIPLGERLHLLLELLEGDDRAFDVPPQRQDLASQPIAVSLLGRRIGSEPATHVLQPCPECSEWVAAGHPRASPTGLCMKRVSGLSTTAMRSSSSRRPRTASRVRGGRKGGTFNIRPASTFRTPTTRCTSRTSNPSTVSRTTPRLKRTVGSSFRPIAAVIGSNGSSSDDTSGLEGRITSRTQSSGTAYESAPTRNSRIVRVPEIIALPAGPGLVGEPAAGPSAGVPSRLHEDALTVADGTELPADRPDQRLHPSEDEVSARLQRLEELLEELLLHRPFEVDDHVAAEDQVLSDGWIVAEQVGAQEADRPADLFPQLKGRPRREPLRANVFRRLLQRQRRGRGALAPPPGAPT